MLDLTALIRPNILSLKPYRCARDDYSAGILLDANENSLGPSIAAVDDSQSLHRYPDPSHPNIKTRLSELRGFKYGHPGVFLGVGSDEIIDLLIRVSCTPAKDAIIICPPTYGMYSVCAKINDVAVVSCPLSSPHSQHPFQPILQDIQPLLTPQNKLLFLTSPGNPTGTQIPNATVKNVLDAANMAKWNGLVVVDEAYIDFSEQDSAIKLFEQGYDNLIVMQTLSKGYGLAGIRFGMSFAHPDLTQVLSNTKAPYNISTPTAHLALSAISDSALSLTHTKITQLKQNRSWLAQELASTFPKDFAKPLGKPEANFLLVPVLSRSTGEPDNDRAQKVYKHLAEELGVVVRFRGMEKFCDGCLRITIGSKEECREVVRTLGVAFELF